MTPPSLNGQLPIEPIGPLEIVRPKGVDPRAVASAKRIPGPIESLVKQPAAATLVLAVKGGPAESPSSKTEIVLVASYVSRLPTRIGNKATLPTHSHSPTG